MSDLSPPPDPVTIVRPDGKNERELILDQLGNKKFTKIYAQQNPNGRSCHIIKDDKNSKPVVTKKNGSHE
jgi:hypothetical protein